MACLSRPSKSSCLVSSKGRGKNLTACMINRTALIIHFKQPFVDWANASEPCPELATLTLHTANDDATVFLIGDFMAEKFDYWLQRHFDTLFTEILEQWHPNTDLWPAPLTLPLFRSWFDVRLHSMVVDTVGDTILDDTPVVQLVQSEARL